MYRKAVLLMIVLIASGCTQEGEVGVRNRTPGLVYLEIDGRGYDLYPNDLVVREIEIGKRCVFGPDETRVLVSGEGDYLFYFSYMARVIDDKRTIIPVYCDAAQLTVTNNTVYGLDLYLAPCSDPDWGAPCDYLPPGSEAVWRVGPGCWDIMLDGTEIAPVTTRYGNILACEDYGFTVYSTGYAVTEAGIDPGCRYVSVTEKGRGDLKINSDQEADICPGSLRKEKIQSRVR